MIHQIVEKLANGLRFLLLLLIQYPPRLVVENVQVAAPRQFRPGSPLRILKTASILIDVVLTVLQITRLFTELSQAQTPGSSTVRGIIEVPRS